MKFRDFQHGDSAVAFGQFSRVEIAMNFENKNKSKAKREGLRNMKPPIYSNQYKLDKSNPRGWNELITEI